MTDLDNREPDAKTLWRMSLHSTKAIVAAMGEDADDEETYWGITEHLRAIEQLDLGYSTPLMLRACVAWCDLTADFAPVPKCPCGDEHDHPAGFTLIDPETGEDLDIDSATPPLRWAARFLFAARQRDQAQMIALWGSHTDGESYTQALVQLAVMVGVMVRKHLGGVDVSGGWPTEPPPGL